MSRVDAAAALREPWERLSDQRRVALFGMWSFIASEVLFFGAMFMTYAYERVLPWPSLCRCGAKDRSVARHRQ